MKRSQNAAVYFWERCRMTRCSLGMEDIAMLVFYLPIIILEAMFEPRAKATDPIHPDRILDPVTVRESRRDRS